MNNLLASFSLLCFLLVSSSFAEPERGRLPDGRAYRTTSDGSEVVDYIAELEVSVDSLKRRINGLEYELEASQKKVERLTKSGGRDSGFAERDLVASKSPETSFPERLDPATGAELQACRESLNQLKQKMEVAFVERSRVSATHESGQEDLASRVALLEQQLADARGVETQLRDDLAIQQQSVNTLTTQLSVQREKAQKNTQSRSAVESELAEQQNVSERASLSSKVMALQQSPGVPALRAIDILRKDLLSEVKSVESLVTTRDKLFSAYHESKKPALAIKAQTAQSQRGFSLSRISQALRSADSMNELTRWRRDLREIERKMNDDVALIRRMMGSRK